MRVSRLIGPGVVAVFVLMALATYIAWEVEDRNQVTGDEPHYLVIADSISDHRSFEISDAYRDEFRTREFYPPGLAPAGTEPAEGPTHSRDGPRGLFSIHSLGLPAVLALPVLLGGTVLAKLVMIAIAACGAWLVWLIGARVGGATFATAAAVAVTTCGMTLVVASNQVYPDVPAAVLGLAVLAYLVDREPGRESSSDGRVTAGTGRGGAGARWCAVALAALPWMHLKALAPAAVLGAALLVVEHRRGRSRRELLTLLVPTGVSLGALAFYNWWAFDRAFGPYGDGALEFGGMPLTVLLGLYVDQFQGMLVQNPALAVGIAFLVPFVRRFPVAGGALVVAHLAFVAPNALHPNWYGGASFAGRFGVSGAVLLAPVAVYGLGVMLSSRRTIAAWGLVGVLAAFQVVQFVRYAVLGRDLYNSLWELPETYHSQVPFARGFLPMLYDSSWSLTHPPNLAGALLVLALLGAGVCLEWRPRLTPGLLGAAVAVVLAAGLVAAEPRTELVIAGYRLPRLNATPLDDTAVATGEPGVVTYGPYVSVGEGPHQFEVVYRSDSAGSIVGRWELVVDGVDVPLAGGDLVGNGGTARAGVEYDIPDRYAGREVEVRTWATGAGPLTVESVVIRNVPDGDPMGAHDARSAEVVR